MKKIGLIITSIVIMLVLAITIFAYIDGQQSKISLKDKKMINISEELAMLNEIKELKIINMNELEEKTKEAKLDAIEGFGYVDRESGNLRIAIIENKSEEDADKVFVALLNVIKEANQKEKVSGESFLKSNVVLKRAHIDNSYYTYLIISLEHEKIESKIKSKF